MPSISIELFINDQLHDYFDSSEVKLCVSWHIQSEITSQEILHTSMDRLWNQGLLQSVCLK